MAESVDALVSNTSGATRAGSTPALGTSIFLQIPVNQVFTGIFAFLRCTKSVLNCIYSFKIFLYLSKKQNKKCWSFIGQH